MKDNNDNFNKERFYEIVDVPKDNAWHEEPGHQYCILGAIVQPNGPGSRCRILKSSTTHYLHITPRDEDGLYLGPGLTFRPLSQKDQAKLQRIRNQYA